MKLTGKCKIDFEKWLEEIVYRNSIEFKPHWLSCNKSMQWGVLVDFFDYNKIFINSVAFEFYLQGKVKYVCQIFTFDSKDVEKIEELTLFKARTAAIKKANKIYNKT